MSTYTNNLMTNLNTVHYKQDELVNDKIIVLIQQKLRLIDATIPSYFCGR